MRQVFAVLKALIVDFFRSSADLGKSSWMDLAKAVALAVVTLVVSQPALLPIHGVALAALMLVLKEIQARLTPAAH